MKILCLVCILHTLDLDRKLWVWNLQTIVAKQFASPFDRTRSGIIKGLDHGSCVPIRVFLHIDYRQISTKISVVENSGISGEETGCKRELVRVDFVDW